MESEIIVAFITGVLGPVTLIFIKNKINKKKPDMVKETLKVSESVTSKLEQIREEYGSDRVWITQFHNGGSFYPTGKSMAKFSVIYEVVSPGVHSIQQNLQNIPVNLFSKSINELLVNDIIAIKNFKDDNVQTFGLKYIAEETNCKSGYLFAIKNIEGKYIGTLGLDYTTKEVELDPVSIYHLSVYSAALGGVLMTHLSE